MPRQEPLPEVLTADEAAAFVRVSEKTLRQLAKQGRVPAQKVGREWRFLRRALETWLTQPLPFEDTDQAARRASATVATKESASANGGFRDSAFTENREQPVHRWVPWIAGYSAGFVADALATVPHRPETVVLDPFAGVGTTLVEAIRHGCTAVGFEINPFPLLACRTKLAAARLSSEVVRQRGQALCEYVAFRSADRSARPESRPPLHFRSRAPLFSPRVERQVLFALDFLAQEPPSEVTDVLRVALGATLVSYSNYSYEPSLCRRVACGKPEIADAYVADIVAAKIEQICEDIEAFQREPALREHKPPAYVYGDSYLDGARQLAPRSVDLLVTSPPYLNNYHYLRNTRPHLYWLNLLAEPKQLQAVEEQSFGKFWQTVRSGPPVPLAFDYPELAAALAELAARNAEKGAYGGPGWANYAATYFNDCARFCQVTARVMKPRARVLVVIGNNILQGLEIKTDEFLAGIAERHGFTVEGMHRVRKKRTGSSIINSSVRVGKAHRSVELYETAVEFLAPGL